MGGAQWVPDASCAFAPSSWRRAGVPHAVFVLIQPACAAVKNPKEWYGDNMTQHMADIFEKGIKAHGANNHAGPAGPDGVGA